MLYGFNTEKVKYAYIALLVMTIIAAIASYTLYSNYSLQQQTYDQISKLNQEQVKNSENVGAFLSILPSKSNTQSLQTTLKYLSRLGHRINANHLDLMNLDKKYNIPEWQKSFNALKALKIQSLEQSNIEKLKISFSELRRIFVDKEKQYAKQKERISRQASQTHLVLLAVFLFLIGLQGILVFYPAYMELQKNVQKVKKTKQDLNYATTHDPITALLNRREGEKTLNWSISNAQEKQKMVGLFHIDIDDFKVINEKMGHAAGDNLLHQTAQKLLKTFRKTDTVARMGGDEFLVIIPNLDCEETLTNLAEKLLDVFSVPYQLLGTQETRVTCSIGMACFPDDARNSQELMVASDMALRKAKEKGKKQYTRFNNSMKSDFNKKMAVCDRIDSALKNKEFEVFYHPQIHMESGCVTGIEALVRWRDPVNGLRSPGSFIETIEASGYMSKLGSYILDKAVSDATIWHNNNINFGRIALNMSSVQLNDISLVNQLLDSLMRHRLPPRYLSIEILENVVMTGQEHRFKQLIDELNDLDIHVELDDFGTGHASLYNLKQFSINRIKLDCDFISDIETNNKQRSIVEGLVKIINNIGLEIIAEGVETTQQALMLKEWGCQHAQGFLYTKPLPFDEMTEYLKQADYKRRLDALQNFSEPSDTSQNPPMQQINSAQQG